MNSEISSEQENKINEILEKGIDQIKCRSSARKEKKDIKKENFVTNNQDIKDSNSKKNDDRTKSNFDESHKKSYLKDFLEKFRKEENKYKKKSPSKESVARFKDIHYEKTSKEDNISLDKENIVKIKERNPKNVSNIKKELSTLQSTIDNLEKKLFDNPSLSLNSPLSNISYEKFYKLNENLSIENDEETINRNKTNNLSMMEYTKQILEKDNISRSIFKTEIYDKDIREHSEFEKTNLTYDKQYDNTISNKKFLELENENIIKNKIFNNSMYKANSFYHINKQDASCDYLMRINFLENCIKEKENNLLNLKHELNNLYLDMENLTLKISNEKKKNCEMESELVKYRNFMNENEELKFKLLKLTDDYNVMCNKYNRSEHIRYQQSNIIHALQREIDLIRGRQIQDALENNKHVINHHDSSDMVDFKASKYKVDDKISDKPGNKKSKKIKKKLQKSYDITENNKINPKKIVSKRSKSKKRV